MLAILFMIAIVGVITYFLVFTQGLFSSLIVCVLSLISAIIAFNYYEALAGKLKTIGLTPYGPEAISLMALFLLSLLVMRIAFDRLIRGNMKFPLLVDRIVSALFGLISGMVIAGIIAIGFQLLPTPTKLLGFDRFPKIADRNLDERNHLFPRVDGFVSTVVGQASMYGFAGNETYTQYHPDFLAELYFNRLTLDPFSSRTAAADCLKVDTAWLMNRDTILDCRKNELIMPDSGELFIAVRLHISAKDDTGTADADGNIRFTLGNIRLVGFDQENKRAEGLSRYPLGILKPGFLVVDGMGYDRGREFQKGQSRAIDLLFTWPEQYKKIKPQWIEFKGSARAAMPSASRLEHKKAPERSHWFDASRNVTQTHFETPAESNVSYLCTSLTILSADNKKDKKKELELPQVHRMENAKEDYKYQEVESTILENNCCRRMHFHYRPNPRRKKSVPSCNLFIPKGFHLLYLQVNGNRKPVDSSFALPTLVDTQNNTIFSVGMKAEGKVKNKPWIEIAYSALETALGATSFKQAYPDYRKIASIENKVVLKKLLVFYLVPSETLHRGIAGCKTYSGVSDPVGQFWNFKDNVDTVQVPPPDKNARPF